MRTGGAAVLALALMAGTCREDDNTGTSTSTAAANSDPRPASSSDQLVLACRGSDATPEDVQALWDRISVPSDTGVGTDLAPGVASVAVRGTGLGVELDATAAVSDRERVIELLAEAPVVAVLSGASADIRG